MEPPKCDSCPYKRDPTTRSLNPEEDTHSAMLSLHLRLPASRTVRDKLLLYISYPVHGISLKWPLLRPRRIYDLFPLSLSLTLLQLQWRLALSPVLHTGATTCCSPHLEPPSHRYQPIYPTSSSLFSNAIFSFLTTPPLSFTAPTTTMSHP